MNGAHLHLLVNHFPVMGLLFGLILLAVSLFPKQHSLKKAALVTIILASLSTIVANSTGEAAEEIKEAIGNTNHELIHEHEESAEVSLWLMLVVAGLAGGTLYLMRKSHPRSHLLQSATLGLGILVFFWLVQVYNLGGQISHPEARPGFQVESR